jgi:hypothetical protein
MFWAWLMGHSPHIAAVIALVVVAGGIQLDWQEGATDLLALRATKPHDGLRHS